MITQEVTDAVQALAVTGDLTPDSVLGAASAPDSPLHPLFDWDDTSAGAKYRLIQARNLIRRIRVEVTVEARTFRVPRYVHTGGTEQGYRELVSVADEQVTARRVVRDEVSRALSALTRASSVAAALGLEGELSEIYDTLAAIRQRIDEAA